MGLAECPTDVHVTATGCINVYGYFYWSGSAALPLSLIAKFLVFLWYISGIVKYIFEII